jgi:hypothetical protein
MKRTLAVSAASVLAMLAVSATATVVSATAATATAASRAATSRGAASGAATSRASIRTYTQQGVATFKGIGSQRGTFAQITENEQVILNPRLAVKDLWTFSFALPIAHQKTSGQLYIVGNHSYAKSDNGHWVKKTLSASALAQFRRGLDLYSMLQQFKALPGVKRLSPTHYSLTAATSRLGSFTSQEFGRAAKELASDGFKTLTINLWTDRSGRPVKITLNSQSRIDVCSITEAFGNFNKPLHITVP